MYNKWGHPVATLPSDGGDCTSLSQNDVNSANQLSSNVTSSAFPFAILIQVMHFVLFYLSYGLLQMAPGRVQDIDRSVLPID
eukprot:6214559-Pleurochrysis_carterae.AAC.1